MSLADELNVAVVGTTGLHAHRYVPVITKILYSLSSRCGWVGPNETATARALTADTSCAAHGLEGAACSERVFPFRAGISRQQGVITPSLRGSYLPVELSLTVQSRRSYMLTRGPQM
jgi:hypothetical protein